MCVCSGLGQPVRYALELAGVEYTDVRVEPGPGAPGTPGYKKMWVDKKAAELHDVIDFPNLPYFFDPATGVVLSQSNTILKYVGRKYGLMGPADKAHIVDLVLDQVADFDGQSTGLSYRDPDALKPYFENQLPAIFKCWAKLLGENDFFTGSTVTIADLKVYETFRKLKLIGTEVTGIDAVGTFEPKIAAFVKRIEESPMMVGYKEGGNYIARPLNNAHAKFK